MCHSVNLRPCEISYLHWNDTCRMKLEIVILDPRDPVEGDVEQAVQDKPDNVQGNKVKVKSNNALPSPVLVGKHAHMMSTNLWIFDPLLPCQAHKSAVFVRYYSPIHLMDHWIMVQLGYWFRSWPDFLCNICWLMGQSAYLFNFWPVPTWNH